MDMNSKRRTLLTAFLPALLLLALAATSAAAQETNAGVAARWVASDEFKGLVADPSPIFNAVSPADVRAAEVAKFPDWITLNRVDDSNQVARLRQRLLPLFNYAKGAGALELIIFRLDHPYVALAEKSALVVSTGALKFFSDSELRAVVAHEISHLYFFDAYLDAFIKGHNDVINRIELKCDALATAIIIAIGERPDVLSHAVRRTYDYEKKQPGGQDAARAAIYPSTEEREKLMRLVQAVIVNKQGRAQGT